MRSRKNWNDPCRKLIEDTVPDVVSHVPGLIDRRSARRYQNRQRARFWGPTPFNLHSTFQHTQQKTLLRFGSNRINKSETLYPYTSWSLIWFPMCKAFQINNTIGNIILANDILVSDAHQSRLLWGFNTLYDSGFVMQTLCQFIRNVSSDKALSQEYWFRLQSVACHSTPCWFNVRRIPVWGANYKRALLQQSMTS